MVEIIYLGLILFHQKFLFLTLLLQFIFVVDAFSIGGSGPMELAGRGDGVKNEKPAFMDDIGIDEHLGDSISLDNEFINEKGETVKLSHYFNGKPVFMMLIYYKCPTLCNTHLNTLLNTFKELEWKIGVDYEFVAISIDPAESSQVAKMKKTAYLKEYGVEGAGKGWHFLTGKQQAVDKITKEIGFKYAWNKEEQEWAHTAAAYILTSKGAISYYHYGLSILPKVLRLSLVEASAGKIGTVMDRVILFCLQYDPEKKTYAFYAYNLMRVGAILIVLILLIFFFRMWRKEKQRTQN
jgi:protein SCO1/2